MSTHEPRAAPPCKCAAKPRNRLLGWSVGSGLLASLGLCAACCLLPMVLVGLGAGGAWIGAMDSLARYKWPFIIATAALLGYGFYAVYWKPKRRCAAGASASRNFPSTCTDGRAPWPLKCGTFAPSAGAL